MLVHCEHWCYRVYTLMLEDPSLSSCISTFYMIDVLKEAAAAARIALMILRASRDG